MRKYLAPNDTHKITIPLVVGAEYAVPTGEGKLTTRISGGRYNSDCTCHRNLSRK